MAFGNRRPRMGTAAAWASEGIGEELALAALVHCRRFSDDRSGPVNVSAKLRIKQSSPSDRLQSMLYSGRLIKKAQRETNLHRNCYSERKIAWYVIDTVDRSRTDRPPSPDQQ